MATRFKYVMKLMTKSALKLSAVTLGSMLTSLLLTVSILLFLDIEFAPFTIWIALVVPVCVAPAATLILLHYMHRLELAQRSQLEHLAKLASIGELASSIVHEINQPLAAIKLIAEGIRRKSNKIHKKSWISFQKKSTELFGRLIARLTLAPTSDNLPE